MLLKVVQNKVKNTHQHVNDDFRYKGLILMLLIITQLSYFGSLGKQSIFDSSKKLS